MIVNHGDRTADFHCLSFKLLFFSSDAKQNLDQGATVTWERVHYRSRGLRRRHSSPVPDYRGTGYTDKSAKGREDVAQFGANRTRRGF